MIDPIAIVRLAGAAAAVAAMLACAACGGSSDAAPSPVRPVRTVTIERPATAADVTFVKGADFYLGPGGEGSARLAFSFATAEEIDEGIARLSGLVRDASAVTA